MNRIPTEKASLIGSVFGFYALQEIEAGIQERRARGHSEYRAEEYFERDFREYADTYYADMAKWLHDYFAITALGEARHLSRTIEQDSTAYITVHGIELNDELSRSQVDVAASYANPIQFLPVLHEAFSDKWYWTDGYGGSSWQRIVEAIQYYYELPATVFIDHVIDLSHNSGLAFDKDILVYGLLCEKSYLEFLSLKSKGSVFDVFNKNQNINLNSIKYTLQKYDWHGIPSQLKRLLTRAHVLGYISMPYEYILGLVVNPNFIFPHIQWGEAEVAICLRESFNFPSMTVHDKAMAHVRYQCGYCENYPCVCGILEVKYTPFMGGGVV